VDNSSAKKKNYNLNPDEMREFIEMSGTLAGAHPHDLPDDRIEIINSEMDHLLRLQNGTLFRD